MSIGVQSRTVLDETGRALLFTEARTANTFADTPVTDEQLAEIWELAKWPPTAANSQPLRVVFIRTEGKRRRLVEHLHDGNKHKTTSAPVIALLAVDPDFHDHLPTLVPFRPELREVFAADDGRRTQTSGFNSALQAGYFILAVRALGLAAGPMTGFDAEGMDAEFFPDGRFRSILVVNIGYPGDDAWMERLPRLDSGHAITWL